jgi:hypothetical protein
VYRGYRLDDSDALKGVVVERDGIRLSPLESQKYYNHSPDGFEWGYCGSGPAQLALAILIDYYGKTAPEVRQYQRFKEQMIAGLPESWSLTGAKIEEVIRG